jgi:hypothetical protein
VNFILHDDLFGQASVVDLLRLFATAVDGRHRVQPAGTPSNAWSTWLEALPADAQEAVKFAADWSTKENASRPSSITFDVALRTQSAWSKDELTLGDAVDLAYRPHYLFLENAESDGCFLMAMLTVEERDWLENLREREWLVFYTAGGLLEIPKHVAWAKKARARLVRAAVLFDSDAVEAPASTPESDANFMKRLHENSLAVLKTCREAQAGDDAILAHYVLRRRAIENYIPMAALERWADSVNGSNRRNRQKLVAAFAALPADRRHRYHLKKGYAKDRKRKPRPPTWLPATTALPLETGFSAAISDCFRSATNQELKQDGGFDELRPFIDTLRRWLS